MKKLTVFLAAVGIAFASGSAVAGDAKAGEAAYSAKGCIGCHGAQGKSVIAANPVLAGKDAAFLAKQLTDFKSGARQNATMNAMAAMLNDADVANVSAYLAAQK